MIRVVVHSILISIKYLLSGAECYIQSPRMHKVRRAARPARTGTGATRGNLAPPPPSPPSPPPPLAASVLTGRLAFTLPLPAFPLLLASVEDDGALSERKRDWHLDRQHAMPQERAAGRGWRGRRRGQHRTHPRETHGGRAHGDAPYRALDRQAADGCCRRGGAAEARALRHAVKDRRVGRRKSCSTARSEHIREVCLNA